MVRFLRGKSPKGAKAAAPGARRRVSPVEQEDALQRFAGLSGTSFYDGVEAARQAGIPMPPERRDGGV